MPSDSSQSDRPRRSRWKALVLEPLQRQLAEHARILRPGMRLTIGSSADADVRLNLQAVEPIHCVIVTDARGVYLQQWNDRTWWNDKPLDLAPRSPHCDLPELNSGDRLAIGPIEFRLRRPEPEDWLIERNREQSERLRGALARLKAESSDVIRDSTQHEAILPKEERPEVPRDSSRQSAGRLVTSPDTSDDAALNAPAAIEPAGHAVASGGQETSAVQQVPVPHVGAEIPKADEPTCGDAVPYAAATARVEATASDTAGPSKTEADTTGERHHEEPPVPASAPSPESKTTGGFEQGRPLAEGGSSPDRTVEPSAAETVLAGDTGTPREAGGDEIEQTDAAAEQRSDASQAILTDTLRRALLELEEDRRRLTLAEAELAHEMNELHRRQASIQREWDELQQQRRELERQRAEIAADREELLRLKQELQQRCGAGEDPREHWRKLQTQETRIREREQELNRREAALVVAGRRLFAAQMPTASEGAAEPGPVRDAVREADAPEAAAVRGETVRLAEWLRRIDGVLKEIAAADVTSRVAFSDATETAAGPNAATEGGSVEVVPQPDVSRTGTASESAQPGVTEIPATEVEPSNDQAAVDEPAEVERMNDEAVDDPATGPKRQMCDPSGSGSSWLDSPEAAGGGAATATPAGPERNRVCGANGGEEAGESAAPDMASGEPPMAERTIGRGPDDVGDGESGPVGRNDEVRSVSEDEAETNVPSEPAGPGPHGAGHPGHSPRRETSVRNASGRAGDAAAPEDQVTSSGSSASVSDSTHVAEATLADTSDEDRLLGRVEGSVRELLGLVAHVRETSPREETAAGPEGHRRDEDVAPAQATDEAGLCEAVASPETPASGSTDDEASAAAVSDETRSPDIDAWIEALDEPVSDHAGAEPDGGSSVLDESGCLRSDERTGEPPSSRSAPADGGADGRADGGADDVAYGRVDTRSNRRAAEGPADPAERGAQQGSSVARTPRQSLAGQGDARDLQRQRKRRLLVQGWWNLLAAVVAALLVWVSFQRPLTPDDTALRWLAGVFSGLSLLEALRAFWAAAQLRFSGLGGDTEAKDRLRD
ncbi:MAG: hypothetical protein D6725_00415 [Planctomycetota bacterium]|nr:MAG: hypothetical protein D6725_00415 [Planctomycetota bacterium]